MIAQPVNSVIAKTFSLKKYSLWHLYSLKTACFSSHLSSINSQTKPNLRCRQELYGLSANHLITTKASELFEYYISSLIA